jgi:hypothetical protein
MARKGIIRLGADDVWVDCAAAYWDEGAVEKYSPGDLLMPA